MHATLIHNPNAGGAKGLSSSDLETLLQEVGYEAQHQPTDSVEDLEAALSKASGLVVVAGVDGTVRAVANHLAGRKIPMAVIPMGTANNIGRALGLVGSPPEMVMGLHQPQKQCLDLGRIHGPWGKDIFLEACGLGLFANTMSAYDPEAGKSPLRALSATVQTLTNFSPQSLSLELDREATQGRFLLLECHNTPATGPRLKLAPQADPCDGWLDVVLIEEGERVGLLSYLTGLIQERLEELPNVNIKRCRKLVLQWDGSPFHLDAEIRQGEGGRIEIKLQPKALELWLPTLQVPAQAA